MISFLFGCIVGGFIATTILCCFMINRQEEKEMSGASSFGDIVAMGGGYTAHNSA